MSRRMPVDQADRQYRMVQWKRATICRAANEYEGKLGTGSGGLLPSVLGSRAHTNVLLPLFIYFFSLFFEVLRQLN
jgi:hypothetical protein